MIWKFTIRDKTPYLDLCRAIRDAISEDRLETSPLRDYIQPSFRVALWAHLYAELHEQVRDYEFR